MDDAATLGEARQWLRDRVDHGERCPCCTQFAKLYRRKPNAAMAYDLIALYRVTRNTPGEFAHKPTFSTLSGDSGLAKLRYWGFVEEEPDLREDGGRSGWWRITDRGISWILRRVSVPKYAVVFDTHFLRYDGPPWTITDALGTRFNYRDLMDGL